MKSIFYFSNTIIKQLLKFNRYIVPEKMNVSEYNYLIENKKIINEHISSIKTLSCPLKIFKPLTQLPILPPSLEVLNCSNQELVSLPELPKTLKVLSCENNKLTRLPNLPDSLEILECDNNYIAIFPDIPKSVQTSKNQVKKRNHW